MVTTVRTAVYLFLWLAVCQVRGGTVPDKMNETIRTLRQHFNFSNDVIFRGKPVFVKEQSGSVEEKILLMGGVLETYDKMFNHMLKQLPKETTNGDAKIEAEGLKYLQRMVRDLKTSKYHQQETLLKKLHDIQHVQVATKDVQNRALWDLAWFFDQAHSLIERKQLKRRRRQARRVPHPRV